MITEVEYNEIKPHREAIINFHKNGHYTGDALYIADKLRQRYGMAPPINYGCNGCKVSALNDLYDLMIEYEQSGQK